MSKKVIALIVAGSLALGGAIGFAASQIEDVTAQINYGISMKLNGAPYNPTEADGSALRPLIYKGRTYLPVAALGKALDVAVKWDGETSTVLIGEGDKMTDFMSIVTSLNTNDITYTQDKELLYAGGKTFDSGLVYTKIYSDGSWSIDGKKLKFNPNGKYSKIGFTIVTDNEYPLNIKVCGDDDEVLKSIDTSEGVQNIELDISGQKEIYFVGSGSTAWSSGLTQKIVLGDIYFK